MRALLLAFIALFFISGCSFKSPENEWQYKSYNAFSAYTKNFLSARDLMAKNDLRRAIEYAKQSADLTQLAKLYLGEYALNISVGISKSSKGYEELAPLLENSALDAYYALLSGTIIKEQIELLPKGNQEFVYFLQSRDYKSANEAILKMDRVTSKLLSSALLKEHLSDATLEKMIEEASFYGYKKAVLFLLGESYKRAKDVKTLELIEKKISILQRD